MNAFLLFKDKGHCTYAIKTGSLSNSPLENDQEVETGLQARKKGSIHTGHPKGEDVLSSVVYSLQAGQCTLINKRQQIAGTLAT